jgi:hypothetical protein
MTHCFKRVQALATAVACIGTLPPGAQAAIVYTQTIVEALATPSFLDDFSNCRNNQGCLGKTGQVFDAAGNALAIGNLPDTLLYTFTLTPAEISAINAQPGGTATLSMTAARDLGLRAGAAVNTDFLSTFIEGAPIGDLFGTTVSTCPASENFNPIDFTCGPNYHNDVTAVSTLQFSSAQLLSAALDGSVSVLVNPTDDVGRLKVFSVSLQYAAAPVPEPSLPWLLGAAVAGAALARRQRPGRPSPG